MPMKTLWKGQRYKDKEAEKIKREREIDAPFARHLLANGLDLSLAEDVWLLKHGEHMLRTGEVRYVQHRGECRQHFHLLQSFTVG